MAIRVQPAPPLEHLPFHSLRLLVVSLVVSDGRKVVQSEDDTRVAGIPPSLPDREHGGRRAVRCRQLSQLGERDSEISEILRHHEVQIAIASAVIAELRDRAPPRCRSSRAVGQSRRAAEGSTATVESSGPKWRRRMASACRATESAAPYFASSLRASAQSASLAASSGLVSPRV